jgi:hypothetical protein
MKRPVLMPPARRVYPSFFSRFGGASSLVVIIEIMCHENAVRWIFRKKSSLDSQCWLVGVRFFKQSSRLQRRPQQRYLSLPSLLLWLICHNVDGHRSLLRFFKSTWFGPHSFSAGVSRYENKWNSRRSFIQPPITSVLLYPNILVLIQWRPLIIISDNVINRLLLSKSVVPKHSI